MKKLVAFTLLMLPVLPLTAADAIQARPKPAWEWTLEERLAKRFDATSQMDRITREATEPYGVMSVPQGTIAKPSATAALLPSIIVGARDPELLLRWELFDVLIDGCFSDDPATRADERRELAENAKSASLTLPAGFWDTLGEATSAQWEIENRNAVIGRRLQKATANEAVELRREYKSNYDGYCQVRAAALDRATRVFGREWFDRFLYQAVAPRTVQIKPGGVDDPQLLRTIEGGCR